MLQMFYLILFVTAVVGSVAAAAWDLRTTEIPDPIPYAMIAIALLVYGYQSVIEWNYMPILSSIGVGAVLFGFGFVLYYFGQWGGGDVKLMSAIGFLLPNIAPIEAIFPKVYLLFPFPLSYVWNVFSLGALYMIVYAVVLALTNRKIIYEFTHEVKAITNLILALIIFIPIFILFVNWFFVQYAGSVVLNVVIPAALSFTIGIVLVWKFVRAVENVAFKRRISVKKLRVGDVLLDSKVWDGITEKDLRRIQRSKKRYIWIKEGVRFAPAFPLALLFTVYYGDAVLLLFRGLM
jgi:hypothetical protein